MLALRAEYEKSMRKIAQWAKIIRINLADSKIRCTFAADFRQTRLRKPKKGDPLAQSVEHNTFNVGVLGSSPKRITKKRGFEPLFFFINYSPTNFLIVLMQRSLLTGFDKKSSQPA